MQGNSPENKDGTISERQSLFFLIGFVLFWIGMLFYDIALIIIASLVTLGSVAVGVFFILRSYEAGDAEHQAISGEIEQMSNDASFDVTEELIIWDELRYSKGIGTKFAGRNSDIEAIHHRLVLAREELSSAETPIHRLEAVLAADSILATARELRGPAQFG